MPLPHDLCSHLQNAFRARHQLVSVPHTAQNLGILSILLRAGFLNSVMRGTIDGPSPQAFHDAGITQRRIWADLKYRDDRPVLTKMNLISLPSRRISMTYQEIRILCSGRRIKTIKPLGLGEIAVIHTSHSEHEWLEAREALQLKFGGEIVCRAG